MPELVIGIPCYNEGRYIIECLQSVAQNDLTDVQVIVSDNQSTDGSYEKIEHFLDSLPKPEGEPGPTPQQPATEMPADAPAIEPQGENK